MKTSSNILKRVQFFLMAVLFISHAALAQDSTKQTTETTVKDWLNEKNFVFTPQTATPMRGRSVHLTSYFDFRVSKDTLVSNLPYYGRAYSASINPSENGLNFTSTKFDYNVTPRKKGGWEVSIKPKDANDVREMSFTVFENGSASVYVTSNNRESISFNGSITQNKKR
jgi:hypothetical protein